MTHPKDLKPFRGNADLEQPADMIPHTRRVLDGEYDLPGLKLPIGSRVLDLGANVGAFTVWASQRWPDAQVCAYECNVDALLYFRENAPFTRPETNPVSSLPLVRVVQGEHNLGEARVVEVDENDLNGIRTIHPADMPAADFIKADMEGSEIDFVRHYRWWDRVIGCAFEYHSPADRREMIDILRSKGFILHSEEEYTATTGILRFYHHWRAQWETPPQPAKVTPQSTTPAATRTDYRHVLLAIPVHYQPTALFCQLVMEVAAEMPGLRIVWHVGDSHPDRARNVLANRFLATDCTQLLFLDADLAAVGEQTIKGLRSLIDRNLPVACGLYPKKRQGEVQWIGNFKTLNQDERGLVQVHEAGTGCMAIRRDVLESMRNQYPDLRYTPDSGLEAESRGKAPAGEEVAFFASGLFHCPRTHRRRWLSEDWAFCRRAWDAGFEVVADPSVFFYHEGNVLFPLSWDGVLKAPNEKTEEAT